MVGWRVCTVRVLQFEPMEAIRVMEERLAAGEVQEEELVAWFRQRLGG